MRTVSFSDLKFYMKDPTMIVLVGVPGSGKSTFCEKNVPEDWSVLSADTVRKDLYGDASIQGNGGDVFNEFYTRLNSAFMTRKHIVIDNTNCKTTARNELHKKAKDAGYKVQFWVFDVPLALCLSRNAARDRKVPQQIVKAMYNSLEATKPTGKNVIRVDSELKLWID